MGNQVGNFNIRARINLAYLNLHIALHLIPRNNQGK